jgi:N-acetylneuraminic acid mutarotase
MTNGIRNASAALLFLVCLVTLTSAFNLPNRSPPDLSPQLAFLRTATKPAQQHTMLTLADRVAYQRAIEEVYWRHRIWPKENPNPKPSLGAVMSEAQLENKVADYLRNSQALEDYWHRPLSGEELQAEMDRMAQNTKQPEVLRELFEALGNDPNVIAECLARSALSGRLVTGLDARQIKTKASRPKIMAAGGVNYTLPTISGEGSGCSDDSWAATSTTNAPVPRGYHTAIWTGSEMIVWGGIGSSGNNNYLNTGGRYNPSTDSWTATNTTNAPTARVTHTAVWTGSEMIVWGGFGDSGFFWNTGGRYNPTADSWTATNITNAPSARGGPTAIWTGHEMIIWGGAQGETLFDTGGRYDPIADSWTATSTTNAPAGRNLHTAIWTGNEMIVWGGNDLSNYFNTGGRYNPSTDSWTATSTSNAPSLRSDHTAVWAEGEMIIWGGYQYPPGILVNTGGKYNPTTDSWMPTSITNVPVPREGHTAIWTGNEMIVWGGSSFPFSDLNTGGRYIESTDRWIATGTNNAPDGRSNHTAVWTGTEMIVWGGDNSTNYWSTGGRYCVQPPGPMPQSAFSRKTQGAAGTFDIPLPVTGNIGVECRSGGVTNDYQVIINFMNPVTVGSASVTSGTGSVSSFSVNGSQVTVNLTGILTGQTITVTLFNVNDGTQMGSVTVWMNALVGDVNGNDAVNASDVALTKSQVGMPVGSGNFREDVDANGTISSTDVAIVKSDVGTALPP